MTETRHGEEQSETGAGWESERIREAQESLERIQKEIAPFLKPRKSGATSTAGQWREGSWLTQTR